MIEKKEVHETMMEFAGRFINRWDMYPKQLTSGNYVSVKEPLTTRLVLSHLKGEITLGTYLLTPQSRARFAVLDADTDEQFVRLSSAGQKVHRIAVQNVRFFAVKMSTAIL